MDQTPKNNNVVIAVIAIVVVIVIIILAVKLGHKSTPASTTVSPVASSVNRSSQDAFNTNLNQVNFAVPVDPSSSKDLSASDKKAIYQSLLNGYKTMTSKDAKAVRAYMTEKATTPAEKNLVTKMSDADLVSLSTRLADTMIMPTPDLFLTSSTVWTKDGNSVTIQYMDPTTGTTTKKVVNINGQWY